jgi:hypothetical protein
VDLLVEVLIEVVFEVFGEVLIELGWASIKEALGRRNHNAVLATVGYLLLGGIVGGSAVWLHPGRIIASSSIPGVSLVVAPLVGGIAMDLWGAYRRGHGYETTNLATFCGGASFSFGASLVRFLTAT